MEFCAGTTRISRNTPKAPWPIGSPTNSWAALQRRELRKIWLFHARTNVLRVRSSVVPQESAISQVKNVFRKFVHRSSALRRPDLAPSSAPPALPSRRSFCAPEQQPPPPPREPFFERAPRDSRSLAKRCRRSLRSRF